MLRLLVLQALLLPTDLPDQSFKALAGSWTMLSNEITGDLTIEIDAQGKVGGSMFGQTIEGHFDPKSRRIEFYRRANPSSKTTLQRYEGIYSPPEGGSGGIHELKGRFFALVEGYGQPNTPYLWKASAYRFAPPSEELAMMRGLWQVTDIRRGFKDNPPAFESLGLLTLGSTLRIEGNRIIVGKAEAGVIANDLSLTDAEEKPALSRFRPMVITLPDGKGLQGGLNAGEDQIDFTFKIEEEGRRPRNLFVRLNRVKL